MSDQRITQLTALPKVAVAATDVLPIVDISASETKKVTAQDLVDAGLDLVAASSIDLSKLDQASVTKLGTAAIAVGAVTAAKLAADSSIAVQTTAPITDNFEGRGYFNSTTGNLQVHNGATYSQVVLPTAGIGDLQVTTGKLADGAVTTAKVTALGTTALADSAVSTAKLADASVTAAKIAADSITATQIAPNAIGASELADNSVDAAALQSLAVTEAKLAGGAVTNTKLGDLAVTDAKIASTTISYSKLNLADGSVPGAKIVADSITTAQIGAAAVATSELADLAVTTAKVADGAVTGAKIATDTITADKIATGAVGTSELGSAAVTYAKIQNTSGTDVLLGRSTAGAGTVEEIICTAAGRALLDDATATAQRATLGLGTLSTQSGTFSGTHSGVSSGTNTGDQTITLTGDVTGSGTGSFATTISSGAVNASKLASDAVSTVKVLNDAITSAKLADNSAAVVAAATPSGSGAFIGQQWVDTSTAIEYTWNGTSWLRQASLSTITISDASPLSFAVAYPDAYSATITTSLDTQSANRIFAGPTTGANAAPTFRAIVPADLPDATSVAKGIILPGSGLSISSGTLNHSNSTTAGTYTKITVDAQGHATAGTTLSASDIPALDSSKITTGTFSTALLADNGVTAAKLADYATAQIGSTLPTADYIGQFFLNPLERTVYMWDGNVWQPVGITAGTVIFAGTYNATTNLIASVTTEGAALGLSVGNALPAASNTNQNYFVIVSNAGTGVAPAPAVALLPPDLILSTGTSWVRIESSDAYIAQVATQVSFTPAAQISSTNVQAALEEVSNECRNATNITSGTLAPTVGGTGLTTYVKGDLIAGSGTNTLAKLTVGTNGFVLKADSSTATGLQWAAYDALVTGGGTMTGNLEIGSTATIVFEGSTADIYETTLTVINPTADNTISLPNATGTVALTSDLNDGTY